MAGGWTGRARRGFWLSLAVAVAAVLLMEARSIVVFHSLAPWGPPSRIHYCGRDYAQAGFVGAGQAKHDGEASAFTLLTRGPLWQPIYGHPASAPQRHRYGVPCAMELFMRGSDGYRSYEIEGGP